MEMGSTLPPPQLWAESWAGLSAEVRRGPFSVSGCPFLHGPFPARPNSCCLATEQQGRNNTVGFIPEVFDVCLLAFHIDERVPVTSLPHLLVPGAIQPLPIPPATQLAEWWPWPRFSLDWD